MALAVPTIKIITDRGGVGAPQKEGKTAFFFFFLSFNELSSPIVLFVKVGRAEPMMRPLFEMPDVQRREIFFFLEEKKNMESGGSVAFFFFYEKVVQLKNYNLKRVTLEN